MFQSQCTPGKFTLATLFTLVAYGLPAHAEDAGALVEASRAFIAPDDAGLVDVTLPPYNVKPGSGKDVTAAIQQAIDDHPNGNRIIYLPTANT